MAKRTILICDCCYQQANKQQALGWKQVDITGIDDSSFSDPVFPADLCSLKCIMEYISGRSIDLNYLMPPKIQQKEG